MPTTGQMPCPDPFAVARCSSTIAASSRGMPSTMSVSRDSTESSQPPRYPDAMPTPAAISPASAVASTPTSSEERVP